MTFFGNLDRTLHRHGYHEGTIAHWWLIVVLKTCVRLCEAAAEKSRQPARTDKACLPLWDRLLSLWTFGAVPDCMVIAHAIPIHRPFQGDDAGGLSFHGIGEPQHSATCSTNATKDWTVISVQDPHRQILKLLCGRVLC